MDFHNILRQETRNHHDQIESAPLLKSITDGNIARADYQLLIEKFYGYIKPCEQQIHCQPWRELLVDREKSHLLEDDLLALGKQKNSLANIKTCLRLPALTEREHALGYLYVIEGSTLGGQVIAKILADQLQLAQDRGSRYFSGYGRNTKSRWVDFCEILNQIADTDQRNKVINAVNLTYTTLYQWMIDQQ